MAGTLTAFGLGFLYFLSAIPAGTAAHAPLWAATLAAWGGYSAGSLAVLIAGTPLRRWLHGKFGINPKPDPSKFFWRIWERFGIWGLGLIAPVTIGPQAMALVCLALGESPWRIQAAVSAGSAPWALAIGLLTAAGVRALN